VKIINNHSRRDKQVNLSLITATGNFFWEGERRGLKVGKPTQNFIFKRFC
jgi:hypothetical protein